MGRTLLRARALVALRPSRPACPPWLRAHGAGRADRRPSRSDQEYVWISNASNLPLFVERVYPGLESARKALNVKVRIAGPTAVDLAPSSRPSMPNAPRIRRA